MLLGVGERGKGATAPHFSDTDARGPVYLRKGPLLTCKKKEKGVVKDMVLE